ncbi:MAG: hypothetical protein QMD46_14165, partial [Methanomicrobiales archaeon]|nr:hypothetical protein [Methanomicrobiales archaeon]
MSCKVKKLVVGKGRTVSREENGEWIRQYYELEVEIADESELSMAKENVEGLLNQWLGIAEKPPQRQWTWDPAKIKWEPAVSAGGRAYERSEDTNNLEFKALLKDLAAQHPYIPETQLIMHE